MTTRILIDKWNKHLFMPYIQEVSEKIERVSHRLGVKKKKGVVYEIMNFPAHTVTACT